MGWQARACTPSNLIRAALTVERMIICELLLVLLIIRAADRLKILIAINRAIKKFNRD